MSWHLVDGVPLPDAVGGHPALDFCNTRAGWSVPLGGRPKEYLTTPQALRLWVADAGLLPSAPPAPDDDPGREMLTRAVAFRDALYACLLRSGAPADWALLAREIAAAHAEAILHPGSDGCARWDLDGSRQAGPAAPLLAVAITAEDLLRSPLAGCVAACPGDGCGWLFADPRRRRRWCSMAVCGNRAKARRFAARHDPLHPRDHAMPG